ncbi:GerAB/ArcD/ProY family transporter [Alicyclobacillus fastidiosus]|uniref:GerAB/ArcD/ProY family transporter n=1 Tax=Alicyclobacillus fastidiosus TaxID=392011 RepID=A0ABV5A956_9BACL|nr:GerAB/ArcD/ProY family transporter [Alicyclobacillus fastidiosus]WEH10684.1 GerAB/ArcD/ProY family transporter [Alicyclobacillus fastidiosus]
MRQYNRNVLTILLFEGFLGTGTMEWISQWTNDFHSNLWLVFAIYVSLLLGLGYLLSYLAQRIPETFDGCTMFDYWFGAKMGGLFNVLLMGALIVYAGKAMLLGVWIIHYSTLPYTPTLAIVVFGLLVPIQLAASGSGALLRFQIVAFWPCIAIAAVLLLLSFRTADLSNLLPVVPNIHVSVTHSFPRLLELLPGLFLLVVFLPLFRTQGLAQKDVVHSFIWASIAIVAWHVLNLLVVLSVFGSYETASLQWPVLEVIRIQKIPNIFLERLDLIFLIPMLTAVVSCVNLYMYSAHHIWSHYLSSRRRQGILFLSLAIIFLSQISSYVNNAMRVYDTMMGVFELLTFCLIPAMFFVAHHNAREASIK